MTLRSIVPVLAVALPAAAQSLQQQHGELLLAAGEPAPGIAGKSVLASFHGLQPPVIGQDGAVLFQARLMPGGVDDRAIYIGRSRDDLRVVVQSGEQAPGLPNGTRLRSSSASSGNALTEQPLLAPFGEVVLFGSRLYDPVTPANTPANADTALFVGAPGALQLLAREGDQVPGLPPGVVFGELDCSRRYCAINADGVAVFVCGLAGAVASSNDAAVVTGTPGNLQVVAREGVSVDGSGLLYATVFGNTLSNRIAINESGEVVLHTRFGGSANNSSNVGVVVWRPGLGAEVVQREGDSVPGMASTVVLVGNPAHNANAWDDSGRTLAGWAIDDGGVTITAANDVVLLYSGVNSSQVVMQEGDPTGLAAGERFGVFVNSTVQCNAAGTFAFATTLRDAAGNTLPNANDTALFVGSAGSWTAVVREGDVLSAIPPTANGPWVCRSVESAIALNARGQLMFEQDANDGVETRDFLLVYDPLLGLRVARDDTETWQTSVGTGQAWGWWETADGSSGDGSTSWFGNDGGFAYLETIDNGVEVAIVRGHSGSMIGSPSTVASTGGQAQALTIDAGVSHAGHLYLVLASGAGSRPGFASPLGPAHVPLNPDAWLSLSLDLANSVVYPSSLGLLDANGRAAASFALPSGVPGLLGVTLHHAAVAFDAAFVHTFSTEAVPLKLL